MAREPEARELAPGLTLTVPGEFWAERRVPSGFDRNSAETLADLLLILESKGGPSVWASPVHEGMLHG